MSAIVNSSRTSLIRASTSIHTSRQAQISLRMQAGGDSVHGVIRIGPIAALSTCPTVISEAGRDNR
jgi:hypothetical protein